MSFWQKINERILEDTSTTGAKFSPLDGLRGIAVMIVFLSHSSAFRQRLTPWTSFHGTGHLGVYLFFVLSGFLLTCSLLAARRVNFPGFYLRRFFRIAPLFYLVVTAVFVVQFLTGGVDLYNLHVKGGWLGYAQHLVFYRGDSVFWTIAAEFQFYLILPFLILALRSGGVKVAYFFAVFAVAYGAWYVLIEMEKIDPIYTLKVAQIAHHSQYLDVFLYGILAAWIFRQPTFSKTVQLKSKTLHFFASAAAVGLVLLSLCLVVENFFGFGRNWRNAQLWWQEMHWPVKFGPHSWSFIYGPAFALITLASLSGHRFFEWVGNLRVFRIIGVTGFSWYLLHFPILRVVNALYGFAPTTGGEVTWSWREPVAVATSFALTSILAIASYLLIEKPFMLLSRNLLRRRVAEPAV